MATLSKLAPQIHLHVFYAVTDLNDLISLLESSGKHSNLFGEHFRGVPCKTIIPSIRPGTATAVEQALQAVCINGRMRYHFWSQAPEPSPDAISAPAPSRRHAWQAGLYWHM